MTTAPVSPACRTARRMISDSNAFSRQPNVMTSLSSMTIGRSEQIGVECALEAQHGRSRHDDVPVRAPDNVQLSAVELDDRGALGQTAAVRGDECRTSAAAAGCGDSGAAFPYPQSDAPGRAHLRDTDIDALREERIVLQRRSYPAEIHGIDIADKERRMGVADIGANRVAQRAPSHLDPVGVHGSGQRDL